MGKINKLLAFVLAAALALVMAFTVGTAYSSPMPTATPTPTPSPTATPVPAPTSTATSTPTLVVGAHDSLHPEGADFVCDGVADQVEIQAAIDELEARGGGRLLFLEGNYNLSPEGDYCLTLVNNERLEGQADEL